MSINNTMTHENNYTKYRKYIIWMFIVFLIIFTLSNITLGADVWDRPVYSVNYTPQFLNITVQLNNLQSQLNNETIQRISNDTQIRQEINYTNYNLGLLQNDLTNNYYTKTQSDNNFYSITNPLGYLNQTYTDVLYYNISNPSGFINSTYLNNSLFVLNNSIYIDIDYLYNITSQLSYNLSYLTSIVDNLSTNMSLFSSQLYSLNQSLISVNQSIKQPTGKYLSYNSSNFYINESVLNSTINNISKNQKNIYSITLNGTTSIISNITISYLITQIDVFTNSTSYRLQVTEYPSNSMIERDRIPHNRDWLIEKNYGINSPVNITVTGTGIFNVQIQYVSNGVQ